MLRIALVGAGGMAGMHASCYGRIDNASLVAVMDIRDEAARTLAQSSGGRPFTDFDEMLSAVRPDIVDVCCPTPFHVDYVCRAAERAGEIGLRGISTEKPMGRTVEDCIRMEAAASGAGIPLFVAHVVRFFPEFRLANESVRAGAIGKPAALRIRRGGSMPRAWNDWYADFGMSGGCILDLIIHDFDWLRWTFGEVDRVFARGLSDALPAFDYALVTLHFVSGAIAHVEGTWADPGGFKVSIELAGDEGMLEYNAVQPAITPFRSALTESHSSSAPGVAVPESPTDVNPYQLELQHFLDCVETGRQPAVTPRDGLEAVRIATAALESCATGLPVSLAHQT